jgi:hypothetical protein
VDYTEYEFGAVVLATGHDQYRENDGTQRNPPDCSELERLAFII